MAVQIVRERQGGDRGALGAGGIDIREVTDVTTAAVRADVEIIERGTLQTVDGIGVRRGRLHGAGALGETCRTVFNVPVCSAAHFHPREIDAARRGVGGGNVLRLGTSGDEVHHDIVDIAGVVAGSRPRGHDGDKAFRTRILAEGELIVGVSVGSGHDGVNRHERGLVRRVGDDTHHHREGVGAVVPRVEGELQVVDGIKGRVYLRQDGHLVVVGAGSGVGIEPQRVVAGGGVGRAGIDNRVTGVRRACPRVQIVPAVGQVVRGTRSGAGPKVEVLREGQDGVRRTRRGDRQETPIAHITGAAIGPHIDIVRRICVE